MKVQDAAIDEFKQLYEQEFGERISRMEAAEMASTLLLLCRLLSRALPEHHHKEPDNNYRPTGL